MKKTPHLQFDDLHVLVQRPTSGVFFEWPLSHLRPILSWYIFRVSCRTFLSLFIAVENPDFPDQFLTNFSHTALTFQRGGVHSSTKYAVWIHEILIIGAKIFEFLGLGLRRNVPNKFPEHPYPLDSYPDK